MKIKLSTGTIVPSFENLTRGELNWLMLKPIEQNMPEDIKEYIKQAHIYYMSLK